MQVPMPNSHTRQPQQYAILKYASIEYPESSFSIRWQGSEYIVELGKKGLCELIVVPTGARIGWRSVRIVKGGESSNPSRLEWSAQPFELLDFLSVFLGEDVHPRRQTEPPIAMGNPFARGAINLNVDDLQAFLRRAELWLENSQTQDWRRACLTGAMGYFNGAIHMGLDLTPVSQATFAVCIEVLANTWSFNPDYHRKFRAKGGPEQMFQFVNPVSFRKCLLADLDLLYDLRNNFGSHFSMHVRTKRNKLCSALKKWMIRYGASEDWAAATFVEDRLLDDLQREGIALYRMSLTLARMGFHLLIGAPYHSAAEGDLRPFQAVGIDSPSAAASS